MNLQEFFYKNNGKYVEVAGSANAKNQCVDLANAYIRDVLGLPIIEWTNAVDFPEKSGDTYEWIQNTTDGYPQAGDIVVFKKYGSLYGDAGHIGVVVYADVKTMKIFEQNYPTGSVCKIGTHNYLGCRGWLRAKPHISGYASVFAKYNYPENMPVDSLDIVFSKYVEWRDKLQLGQLLTKDESDQKLKDAQTALQRDEMYRQLLAKSLFGDSSGGWDRIIEAIPKIIAEADSDKIPAKAAHELFGKVNSIYHNVYVYPEDVNRALDGFYSLYLEKESKLSALEAQKIVEDKHEVINITPEQAKSFIDQLIDWWRAKWQK